MRGRRAFRAKSGRKGLKGRRALREMPGRRGLKGRRVPGARRARTAPASR